MPRLFTGLELPQNIRQHLMLLRGEIDGARWIEPEDYHITLRFAGDVEQAVADELRAKLAQIRLPGFELRLQGTGAFGTRRPRSIHALVEPCDELEQLRKANEKAAIACSLGPETRPFIPHVTLARLRSPRPAQAARFLQDHAAFASAPFQISHFTLFSARPSRGGGPYGIVERFELDG